MCGRFVAVSHPDGLVRFLVIDERRAGDLAPNYNVAPTQDVYAAAEHDGRRYLVNFRWGLVPSWADDLRVGARMVNARVETAHEKPAFRDSFARRRCLIPADGFYEWRRDGDRRQPHFIHQRDGGALAFAGLWASWRDPSGARVRTCTILTRSASDDVRDLHDRMPVALPADAWDEWLDADAGSSGAARLLDAVAPPRLTHHPVSDEVNRHVANHPGLLVPVTAVG